MSAHLCESNSSDSIFSNLSTSTENEVRSNDSCKAFPPFLHQYEHEIVNLHTFYSVRQLDLLETGERDFFEINCLVLEFIQNNLNEMHDFIEVCINKYYQVEQERVLNLWTQLQNFLTNHFENHEDNYMIKADPSTLENNFNKLLLSLAHEEFANKNGIKEYLWETNENERQSSRTVQEFAKTFLILLLDIPAYVVILNDDLPIIELKIYLVEIRDHPFDYEIMYLFLRKNYDSSVYQSSSTEDKLILNSSATSDFIGVLTERDEGSLDIHELVEENLTSKPNELSKLQNDSCIDVTKKYYSNIRLRFDLNKRSECRFFTMTNLKKPSVYLIIFKLLLSFLSINDIFLDISLICNFFQTDRIIFGILTVSILLMASIINIFFEQQYLKKYSFYSNYLPNYLNHLSFNYICGFLQLSKFLRTLRVTKFLLQARREQQIKTLLKITYQSDSGNLQWETQHLKYIETYLESVPQMLLQIYIILKTNEWGWLQLLSIITGIININFTAFNFAAMEMNIYLSKIWRHPIVILKILCYNGFLITSHVLLFGLFHWTISFIWITLHFLVSYFSKWNEEDETLIFINFKISQIEYWTVFNKMTIIENIVLFCTLCLTIDTFRQPFYAAIFISQVIFSAIWTLLVIRNKFYFSLNIMHIPFLIRNRCAD